MHFLEAGNLLDIQLIDHIILTPEREINRSFAFFGLQWYKVRLCHRSVFIQTQKIKNVCKKGDFNL